MFTGLIEELGSVAGLVHSSEGARIEISARIVTEELSDGDSISVNGVCLTALDVSAHSFFADVSPETLRITTLGTLGAGSRVNLERAMMPTSRLGGHIVQGHVDGCGTFISAEQHGDFRTVKIGFPPDLAKYLVHKGSIAIEGISLTIAELFEDSIDIAVIPKTWETTNLSSLSPNKPVNIEPDLIAKYVERMLQFKTG